MSSGIHKENLIGWENIRGIENDVQISKIKNLFLSEGDYYKSVKNIYLVIFCVLLFCSTFGYVFGTQALHLSLIVSVFSFIGIISIFNSKLYLKRLKEYAKEGKISIIKCHLTNVESNAEITYGYVSRITTIYGEACCDTFIIEFSTAKRYIDGYKDNLVIAKCLDTYKIINLSL